MKTYSVTLEISGPIALWARPDTMPNPVSYGGPLRKSDQIKNGSSLQEFAQALIKVFYRLYANVNWIRGSNGETAESPDGQCAPHAYVDAFQRRMERVRWFHTPSLGWKEFVPDYVGPFRDGTALCGTECRVVPSFQEGVHRAANSSAK